MEFTAQPASLGAENLTYDELFDAVTSALGALSALSGVITIDLHTPLPAADISALACAIEAPGMRFVSPRHVEIVGNTRAAQLTVRIEVAGGEF